MSNKRLGKGLDALLEGGLGDLSHTINETVETSDLTEIKLTSIIPNNEQPRSYFDEESLKELSVSIKNQGVLQPLLVEAINEKEYRIIAGERRYRASLKAGLSKVPVIIKKVTDRERLEIALVENTQRENLTPLEEAKAYALLMESMNLSQKEVADKVGKSRSAIANSVRLLQLPEHIGDALDKGSITSGHARAILSVSDETEQKNLFNSIINEGLTVREAERFYSSSPSKEKKENSLPKNSVDNSDTQVVSILEQQFIEVLGTKVKIKGSLEKGKLEISFFSKEDLDRIYDILKQ